MLAKVALASLGLALGAAASAEAVPSTDAEATKNLEAAAVLPNTAAALLGISRRAL
jgi:hypothetical protein